MGKRFSDKNVIIHPYSLVEMLVVIAIIAILVGVGAGGYTVAKKWMAKSRTEALLAKLKIAIEAYKNDKGYYPLPNNQVVNFSIDVNAKDYTGSLPSPNDHLQPRNNMNKYVDYAKVQQDQSVKVDMGSYKRYYVKDGWNSPADGETFGAIKYRSPGVINKTSFDMYSAGPDREFGTEDDIYCQL